MKIIILLAQVIFLAASAPFINGFIKRLKNSLRMRKGAPLLQPYYNLAKLFSKEEVVSENASWIFRITPYIVLSSCITALFLVPVFGRSLAPLCRIGDLIALIFIFSLGRFFLSLAGLDAASSFGGMGSSREMFISSLAEPAAIAAAFAVSLASGSTHLQVIDWFNPQYISSVLAAAALFIVAIAETSRIPIDNQETHLELTMVHEAMVLEYSGRSLAMLELAAHIKQAVFFSLIAGMILPWPFILPYQMPGIALALCVFIAKIAVISLAVALIEVSMAKMRLFRVADLLGFALVLAIMALLAQSMGL